MPDKTYGRCAGSGQQRCIRCWVNKLNHGNKLKLKKKKKDMVGEKNELYNPTNPANPENLKKEI